MVSYDDSYLADSLGRINWNFPDSENSSSGVSALHWFPGNFFAELPRYLIKLLSSQTDLVVDPFCGSGTTGTESLGLGRNCILADSNLAGLQVAKGKMAAIAHPELAETIESIASNLAWNPVARNYEIGKEGRGQHSELRRWLHEDTLKQLLGIWRMVEESACEELRAVLETTFTSTLFSCAGTKRSRTSSGGTRRHHWGWLADNVRPKELCFNDALQMFRIRLYRAAEVMHVRKAMPGIEAAYSIVRHDAHHIPLTSEAADLVVTSPPYLGMIDYTLANRLTYLWMNWSMPADLELEIGARCRRNRRDAVESYLMGLSQVGVEIHRILKPRGRLAIVIGSSRKYPESADKVLDLYEGIFKRLWGPFRRVPVKRRVAARRDSPPAESVCVFTKR